MLPPMKSRGGKGKAQSSGGRKQPQPATKATATVNRNTWDAVPDSNPRFHNHKGHPVSSLYDHINFPPYQFHEYPKHVQGKDGKAINVLTAEEEALVTGGDDLVREEDVKAELIALADGRGVKVDRRWSAARIQGELDDAVRVQEAAKAALKAPA